MPIVDCGFPPLTQAQRPDGSTVSETGQDRLQFFGPTLGVEVGFEESMYADGVNPASIAASLAQGQIRSSAAVQLVPALVDTGARESCIDEDLAMALGLPLVDRQMCAGVGGEHELNIYLGHIRIPGLDRIQWGRFLGAKLSSGRQGPPRPDRTDSAQRGDFDLRRQDGRRLNFHVISRDFLTLLDVRSATLTLACEPCRGRYSCGQRRQSASAAANELIFSRTRPPAE